MRIGQLGTEGQQQATFAGQCLGGPLHGQIQAPVDLREHGLLHRLGHGGQQALAEGQAVAGTAAAVARLQAPLQRAAGGLGQSGGHLYLPLHGGGLASGHVHLLRRQLQVGHLGLELHLHGLTGAVAHGEQGGELVALAHHRG